MDQSKALQKLTEAADLVGMIEELVRTNQSEKLSGAASSGMRITLRSIRESILSSHDVFAGELVSRTRSRLDSTVQVTQTSDAASQATTATAADSTGSAMADPSRLGMRRQSLRATLEKLADS